MEAITMPSSNNNSLSLFCCVLGDIIAFQVTFDKAWNIYLAKMAIVREREDLFPFIVPGSLVLYQVDIPSKEDARLQEYKPEPG
jgi:crinkler effector protein